MTFAQTFQDLKSGIENPFLEKDWISNPFSKVDLDLDFNPNFNQNCQIQSKFQAQILDARVLKNQI